MTNVGLDDNKSVNAPDSLVGDVPVTNWFNKMNQAIRENAMDRVKRLVDRVNPGDVNQFGKEANAGTKDISVHIAGGDHVEGQD